MNRQFLTDNNESPAVWGNPRESAQPTEKTGAGEERTLSEVLAGALPEWDLLPASPFVRRVK